jgi:hypothetical protein
MSIRTTVTLEQDVIDRVKDESKRLGVSFRETLNELLRDALAARADLRFKKREFRVDVMDMGERLFDFSYDCTPELLERLDGPGYK